MAQPASMVMYEKGWIKYQCENLKEQVKVVGEMDNTSLE